MPRKLPPYVECWRDRHGKPRVYFRRGKGPRVALPGPIGSDEFNAAYHAALSGVLGPVRERHIRNARGTIGALIDSYKKSAEYIALRETTKAGYASRLETILNHHGHRSVAGLTRQRILTDILQAVRRSARRSDIDLKNAADTYQARDRYFFADPRPFGRHQTAEAQKDPVVD
jgi:hypothetical protein